MSKIWAHRGFSKSYPENTLLAFQKAEEVGIDGLETDLQLTKDGIVVLLHDETIDRTSDGRGWVKDYTFAELGKFSFYNHMDIAKESGRRILRLEELLEWMEGNSLLANLELKTSILPYPGLVGKTMYLLDHYQMKERILLSSFNHHSLLEAKAIDPDIPCGALTCSSVLSPGSYCQAHGFSAYHPLFTTLYPEDLADLKEKKIAVNTWTVDRPEDMRSLAKKGIDHLITNDPILAKRTLATA